MTMTINSAIADNMHILIIKTLFIQIILKNIKKKTYKTAIKLLRHNLIPYLIQIISNHLQLIMFMYKC